MIVREKWDSIIYVQTLWVPNLFIEEVSMIFLLVFYLLDNTLSYVPECIPVLKTKPLEKRRWCGTVGLQTLTCKESHGRVVTELLCFYRHY